MENLDPTIVWLLGILAMLLVAGVKWYANKNGKQPPTVVLQWICVGMSFIVALVFQAPVIPPFTPGPDPIGTVSAIFAWITALLTNLSPLFMFATLIYTTLWKLVVEKLANKVLKKPTPAG